MKVFVLVSCFEEMDLWGNCLFYDSVRNSFPDHQIIVYDNCSVENYRNILKQKADHIGADFNIIQYRYAHSDFIVQLIHQETEPFYLIDPDTVWVEPLTQCFDSAVAGRYMPAFYSSFTRAYNLPRIHTSCMYIDPIRCKSIIERSIHGDRLIHQTGVFSWNHVNYFLDSFCLFYTFYSDQCQVFSDNDNGKFAHLHCGSHISLIHHSIPELLKLHKIFQSNLISIEELYSIQNDYFEMFKWEDDVLMPPFTNYEEMV